MNHWIIVPVVLPALVAPFIVTAARHDIVLQRVFGIAASAALLAVAIGLFVLASDGGIRPYALGNWPAAVRDRAGPRPALRAHGAAHRDPGAGGGDLRRRRAGTAAAGISTPCSSSS